MKISEPQVLKSNAGYYIGRTCHDEEIGMDLPYERLSDYFSKRADAERALPSYLV